MYACMYVCMYLYSCHTLETILCEEEWVHSEARKNVKEPQLESSSDETWFGIDTLYYRELRQLWFYLSLQLGYTAVRSFCKVCQTIFLLLPDRYQKWILNQLLREGERKSFYKIKTAFVRLLYIHLSSVYFLDNGTVDWWWHTWKNTKPPMISLSMDAKILRAGGVCGYSGVAGARIWSAVVGGLDAYLLWGPLSWWCWEHHRTTPTRFLLSI